MFNDRDIAVIGAGAFASILCLLLPVPFPWKVGVGFTVLAAAMVAALIRLGRDRLTLEEFLFRRIRWWLRPKLWTFRMRDMPGISLPRRKKASPPESPPSTAAPVREPARAPTPALVPAPVRAPVTARIAWRRDAVIAERAASLLMIVVGFYFLDWLRIEGAATLGADLAWLLP